MQTYSYYSEELKKYDRYKNTKMSITKIDKKNKTIFRIKDGLLTINVTIVPNIICQCGSEMCNHIKYLLINFYKLSIFSVSNLFIDEIKTYFIQLCSEKINKTDYDAKIKKIIYEYFNNKECPCCLDKINDKNSYPHIYVCANCKQFTHSKCISRWLTASKSDHKGCMFCRSKVS